MFETAPIFCYPTLAGHLGAFGGYSYRAAAPVEALMAQLEQEFEALAGLRVISAELPEGATRQKLVLTELGGVKLG